MGITVKDDQSTSFSTAAAFADSTTRAEFWGVDDSATPTEHEDIWVQLVDPDGTTVAPIKVPAGQTYVWEIRPGRADNWSWQVRADASTTDIIIVET